MKRLSPELGYSLPFILLMATLSVTSMYRKTAVTDEPGYFKLGKSVLERNLDGPLAQKMPIVTLNVLPFHLLQPWHQSATTKVRRGMIPNQTWLFISRLPTVLASMALGMLVFIWANQLYGLRGGLLSLTLYTFSPNILAHSRWMTNEIYCAFFMLGSIYFLTRYAKKATIGNLIAMSSFVGLAQISKQTSVLLLPIIAFLLICHRYCLSGEIAEARARGPVPRALRHIALFLAIVVACINLGYSFQDSFTRAQEFDFYYPPAQDLAARLPDLRLPLPKAYVESFDRGFYVNSGEKNRPPMYLLGELKWRDGWWHYFPVALLLKLPLAFIAMIIISATLFTVDARSSRRPFEEWSLITAALAILAFFMVTCKIQIGLRYVLPILPFLHVFAGRLVHANPIRHSKLRNAAVAGLLAWYIGSSISFFPHYLSYFNELIGDRKNMYKYLADSNVDWKQNGFYIEEYLRQSAIPETAVNPDAPVKGTVIVNVNRLVGIKGGPERFRWLREQHEPIDHIAYSWLVFEVP